MLVVLVTKTAPRNISFGVSRCVNYRQTQTLTQFHPIESNKRSNLTAELIAVR